MKTLLTLLVALLAAVQAPAQTPANPKAKATAAKAKSLDDQYVLTADSQEQPGVPRGEVMEFELKDSKAFPGYPRKWAIYVPKQYDGSKPACLMVFQDGLGYSSRTGAWRVPTVFDNLIHKGEMPVTIGIFIQPGILPAPSAEAQARYYRSHEYDAVNGR
ncbi:MAG: esterase family protein, partial [Verrucomicrobiota bacterium]